MKKIFSKNTSNYQNKTKLKVKFVFKKMVIIRKVFCLFLLNFLKKILASEILELTKNNFDAELNGRVSLVEFYPPKYDLFLYVSFLSFRKPYFVLKRKKNSGSCRPCEQFFTIS